MKRKSPIKSSIQERLLGRVHYSEGGCWIWTGGLGRKGYGQIAHNGKTCKTHRVAYETFIGPIPEGMLVCHHCDNPPCLNPAHLFLGTNSDNMQDAIRKGRFVRNSGGNRKLSDEQRLMICVEYQQGETKTKLGRKYGVAHFSITEVLRKVGIDRKGR